MSQTLSINRFFAALILLVVFSGQPASAAWWWWGSDEETNNGQTSVSEELPAVADGRSRKITNEPTSVAEAIEDAAVSKKPLEISVSAPPTKRRAGPGLKSFDEVNEYTSCMLAGDDAAKKRYESKYRGQIKRAGAIFNVEPELIACTCGRESRFDSGAKSHTGAQGICQATGGFATEISRKLTANTGLAKNFEKYVEVAAPECKKTVAKKTTFDKRGKKIYNLSKEDFTNCAGLGLAAAAIYLRHIENILEPKKAEFRDGWEDRRLDVYTIIAGSYNIGDGYADQILADQPVSKWSEHLTKDACTKWLPKLTSPEDRFKKMKEVRGHMIAIRNCLQRDNYFSHTNQTMKGTACANKSSEAVSENNTDFLMTMPVSCDPKKIKAFYDRGTPGPSETADSSGGLDGSSGG